MKTLVKFIFVGSIMLVPFMSFAQGTPPPPPGGHGQSNNQGPGGSADIGGGLLTLTLLGAGYGIKQYNKSRKTNINQ